MKRSGYLMFALLIGLSACKKEGCTDPTATNYNAKANKNDGSCTYGPAYPIPATYTFTNSLGNNSVDISGQTDRLNQLRELIAYAETGTTTVLDPAVLKAMFENTNGNANGAFTFSSTRQLKNKCFPIDTALIQNYLDAQALASNSFSQVASNGQAGIATSGTSTYLLAANGFQYSELIEKGIMGAVFEYQALSIYFSDANMAGDNTTLIAGTSYTELEHYWDEAFGYFGVPIDFPTTAATDFWGKYCNSQDATLQSNSLMMNNFLKGRAAIVHNSATDRNAAIAVIRATWENIAAYQAMHYLDLAVTNFGSDQAKTFHVLTEAYGFIQCLRYAPLETRKLTVSEVDNLLAQFNGNLWTLTLADIQSIKTSLNATY